MEFETSLATAIGSDASCERRQSFAGDTKRGALDRNSERSCKVEDGKITNFPELAEARIFELRKAGMERCGRRGQRFHGFSVRNQEDRANVPTRMADSHRRVHVVRMKGALWLGPKLDYGAGRQGLQR